MPVEGQQSSGVVGGTPGLATQTSAGLQSAPDKVKLDGYPSSPPLAASQTVAGLMSAVDKAKVDGFSTVATIAALRTTSPLIAGEMVYVTCFSVASDGGHGFFRYDNTDTATPDDGGVVIVNGSFRWKRQIYDGAAINSRWFGLQGGGGTDATAAMQAAVNFVQKGNNSLPSTFVGRNILVPAGFLNISDEIVISQPNVRIICAGGGEVNFTDGGTTFNWSPLPGGGTVGWITGTINGTFTPNEVVTQAVTGATGRVVAGTQAGNSVKLTGIIGTPDATNTWTGGTSGKSLAAPLSVPYAAVFRLGTDNRRFGADGVTNNTTAFTSASANFTSADLNHNIIVGTAAFAITVVNSATSVTLSDNPRTTATGVSWVLNEYDAPAYDGATRNFEMHGCCIQSLIPNTTLSNGVASYVGGLYGVRDFRGGAVILEDVLFQNCEAGFWGVQSDFNIFKRVLVRFNKTGIYMGPRSDQSELNIMGYENDTMLTLDACSNAIVNGKFVGNGSNSQIGVVLTQSPQYAYNNTQSIGHVFDGSWFEINGVSYNPPAFVKIDSQVTGIPVVDASFQNLTIVGPDQNTTPHVTYFAQIGNADRPKFDFTNAGGAIQWAAAFNFTGTTSPSVKLFGWNDGSRPPKFVNSGSGSPKVSIWTAANGGWQMWTYSPDNNCNVLDFITYGNSVGGLSAAVKNTKFLSEVRAQGYDGTAVGIAGYAAFTTAQDWSVGHHGAEYVIACNLNDQTGPTTLVILNLAGNGTIQFPLGNQLFFPDGSINCQQGLVVTGNTTTKINPYCELTDTHGNAFLQLITNSGGYFWTSGLRIATSTNDDIYWQTNGVRRLTLAKAGEVIWQQNTSAIVLGNNGIITTAGVGRVIRLAPTGNVTGAIMGVGFATGDTAAAQENILRNESAFTITFDVVGTSHVIGGTSKVIPPFSSVLMTFDGTNWN